MSEATDVPATLADSIIDAPAGAIKFYAAEGHDPHGFHFQCPCGCGSIGRVTVIPGGWTWNGSKEKPTVSPSVDLRPDGDSHWHGWLRDGVWRSV